MSSKKSRKKRGGKPSQDTAPHRGIKRAEHFAEGRGAANWRGLHQVHTSRAEKRTSRSSEKKKAIQDSSDEN